MTSAGESVASRVPYNTINFGVKYEPVLRMCRRIKSRDYADGFLDIPCLRCVCVCVCIVFQAEGCYGEWVCACFTYFTMKVDKDAERARPLPPLSVLTSCNNERCHSGAVPGALATRKPTWSFHVWYKETNDNKKWNDVCGDVCKTLYFRWKEDSSVLFRPARDGNPVLIWK